MTKNFQQELARGKARIVTAPAVVSEVPRHQVDVDRNFELPTGLYAATAGLYVAFLAILATGFAAPGMIIPMAICAVFLVGFFGVPAAWTRLRANASKSKTVGEFKRAGIMTYTGHCNARDAAVQMLILPVLVVLWAGAVVTIAALV
ncbi:hypothetical protein [Qipengyuania nanhaisediminis]|uniref:hypothetical protein n=1 Tax=Qipengyuania nanhaisediminis TaxID=604088 RepID=UPI0038B3BFCF